MDGDACYVATVFSRSCSLCLREENYLLTLYGEIWCVSVICIQAIHFTKILFLLLLMNASPPLAGEGFNLRRDVHMRAATLVRLLQEEEEEEGRRAGSTTSRDWVLVLPPWPQLYHWQSTPRSRSTFLPWGKFFDLPSLNQFVPTIEFDDYLKQNGRKIDEVGCFVWIHCHGNGVLCDLLPR